MKIMDTHSVRGKHRSSQWFFWLLYLVTAEWIENPGATAEEATAIWKQMVDPSLAQFGMSRQTTS